MASRILSSMQRQQVRRAIRDGHLAFLGEMFGPTAIDREDYERLRASGKIRAEKLLPQDAAFAAHSLGSIVGHEQLSNMVAETQRQDIAEVHGLPAGAAARTFDVDKPSLTSPEEFWRRVRDDPQVVTEAEREAVEILRERIGQNVRGLGEKLDASTGQILTDTDDKLRRRRLATLQRETARGIEERAAASDVAARVRESAKGLRKDWFRTVHTEMHNATEEAKAIVLAHRSRDRDPRVFKLPRVDACAFCKLLYLKKDGVTPRVFRLSELLANGTNVGRRAGRPSLTGKTRTEWKPVVGVVHPLCKCSLQPMPDGHTFDTKGKLVRSVRKSVEDEPLDHDLVDHECEP